MRLFKENVCLLFILLLPILSSNPQCSFFSPNSISCTHMKHINITYDRSKNGLEILEISNSSIECLDLVEISTFPHLQTIRVTKSEVKKLFCETDTEILKTLPIKAIVLNKNKISCLDQPFPISLSNIEVLDLSMNEITQIGIDFRHLKKLKMLNISNNLLSGSLNPKVLKKLPPTIESLDLTDNPWPCSPTLSWLHPWYSSLNQKLKEQLKKVTCRVINSHQIAPLFLAMKIYSVQVDQFCPQNCSCVFYHFSTKPSPTYSLFVNCSKLDLASFPTLPPQTTILDISYNNLSDQCYDDLNISVQHYSDLSGIILSHNHFNTINPKLNKLKLHRQFEADHNNISRIPYDFSLLLQSFPKTKIRLGHNPWLCSCNAEITNLVNRFRH